MGLASPVSIAAATALALACAAGLWRVGERRVSPGIAPGAQARAGATGEEAGRSTAALRDPALGQGPVANRASPARKALAAPQRPELTVRVRDLRGAPLAGARVELLRGARVQAQGVADARGRVDFGALERGAWGLRLDPDSLPADVLAPRATWVALENGESRELELRAAARAPLSGRVRDPGGAPLAAARVRAVPLAPDPLATHAQARTDADGRFELAGLRADGYRLVVELPDDARTAGWAAPRPREVHLTPEGLRTLELMLEPARPALGGRLLDLAGAPAERLTVVCMLDATHDAARGPVELARCVTDAEGRFLLRGVPREPLVLRVAAARPRGGPLGSRRGARGPAVEVELVHLPADAPQRDLGSFAVVPAGGAPR